MLITFVQIYSTQSGFRNRNGF